MNKCTDAYCDVMRRFHLHTLIFILKAVINVGGNRYVSVYLGETRFKHEVFGAKNFCTRRNQMSLMSKIFEQHDRAKREKIRVLMMRGEDTTVY